MTISLLQLINFRHFEYSEVKFEPEGFNFLVGENGSGKTSLLEAIHTLSLGRSFRTAQFNPLIKKDKNEFVLYGELLDNNNTMFSLGVTRNRVGDLNLHLNRESIHSISMIAPLLPIKVIHSQSHHLFEMGPLHRRKFLDWGLFYHFPEFMRIWRNYNQVLKQRNQLLREQKGFSQEILAWNNSLIEQGNLLHNLRMTYLSQLSPYLEKYIKDLLPQFDFTIEYQYGWRQELSLGEALKQSKSEEIRSGFTVVGPHRADLSIKIDKSASKLFLSRGQQKLLICGMIIAQGNLCFQVVGRKMVYLLDDLSSELDDNSTTHLLGLLSQQSAQIIATAISQAELMKSKAKITGPNKMFHVKHQLIEPIEAKC